MTDEMTPTSIPLDSWLGELAESKGTPGGGAASGVMLGLSAGLLHMVTGYSTEAAEAVDCGERVVALRRRALDAAEADSAVSARLGHALAMPREDAEREARVSAMAVEAVESSAALGRIGLDLLEEVRLLAGVGNPHLEADVAVAAAALVAGLTGAITNLRTGLELAHAHPGGEDLDRYRGDLDRFRAAQTDAAILTELETLRATRAG